MSAQGRRATLVFVSVLAVLVVVLFVFPDVVGRGRELRRHLVCVENLARIRDAVGQYAAALPQDSSRWLATLVDMGVLTERQCVSPVSGLAYRFLIPKGTAGIDDVVASDTAWLYAPLADGEGGSILFVGGHASFYRPAEFRAIIDRSRRAGVVHPRPTAAPDGQ